MMMMINTALWVVTPCNSEKSKGFSNCVLLLLVCFLAYSLTLNMEAICSSETSVEFHWTKQRYNPEEDILYTFVFIRFQ
jgi:hypothetical protein